MIKQRAAKKVYQKYRKFKVVFYINYYQKKTRMKAKLRKQKTEIIESFLKILKDWGCKKTIDKTGVYNEGSDLYFKNIGGNQYLIFAHNTPKPIWNSGFDVLTAIYSSEEIIGSEDPVKFEEVVFSYNHKNDFHLIKGLIER